MTYVQQLSHLIIADKFSRDFWKLTTLKKIC